MGRTFARNQEIEAAPLNEEAILFDPASTKFFMLNSTSAFIWEQLPTASTIEALAAAVASNFDDVPEETAIDDVRATVEEMVSMELVIESSGS